MICDWCKGDRGWWRVIKGCDGDVDHDWETCEKCKGTGEVEEPVEP
jgi:hypothetical protein